MRLRQTNCEYWQTVLTVSEASDGEEQQAVHFSRAMDGLHLGCKQDKNRIWQEPAYRHDSFLNNWNRHNQQNLDLQSTFGKICIINCFLFHAMHKQMESVTVRNNTTTITDSNEHKQIKSVRARNNTSTQYTAMSTNVCTNTCACFMIFPHSRTVRSFYSTIANKKTTFQCVLPDPSTIVSIKPKKKTKLLLLKICTNQLQLQRPQTTNFLPFKHIV